MNLIRSWTPNSNLLNVQDEMHRVLHDLVMNGEARPLAPTGFVPAVDVVETEKGYTLQFDLPGVNPKDVKIELVEQRLTVRGERASAAPAEDGATTHRLERAAGSFERAFRLRARVDANGIKAGYRDGVLTIDVPKAPEAVKREIAIEVG
jgi:HSP20 family protein